jgi:hypothetical protein
LARLVDSPVRYLKRELSNSSRVLLINPPVQERRYHWLRWNQPTELLRLSTWLRTSHPGIDVRLFDFMFPEADGTVPKQKVKETWTGADDDDQLWHFGQSYETFEREFRSLLSSNWTPDLILVSSLTSYWHVSVEKLLFRLCTHLGPKRRKKARICLYGNYPRFEPKHAGRQSDADVAFTQAVDTRGCCPDLRLYVSATKRLPAFCALDINDSAVGDHLEQCLGLYEFTHRQQRGVARRVALTVAFFNEDVCSDASQIDRVISFVDTHPGQLICEGIAGIEPRSLSAHSLGRLKNAGFISLFVEHARLPGGGIDTTAYESLIGFLLDEEHKKKSTAVRGTTLTRSSVTGFVAMGLPDDEIDELVRSTLIVNRFFHAVILKPQGYSPTVDQSTEEDRRVRLGQPYASSPQWFPYVRTSERLKQGDYDNLVRWQNMLNKKVKGSTFDFLDDGAVAKLVRETLIVESWKRHREAQ